jgi:hypothetical protein
MKQMNFNGNVQHDVKKILSRLELLVGSFFNQSLYEEIMNLQSYEIHNLTILGFLNENLM